MLEQVEILRQVWVHPNGMAADARAGDGHALPPASASLRFDFPYDIDA